MNLEEVNLNKKNNNNNNETLLKQYEDITLK